MTTHPFFTRGPMAALLLSTALTATLAAHPGSAAGIPVVDATVASIMEIEAVQTAKSWITQGAQMVKTIGQGVEIIQQGQRMIQQGEALYNNFTNPSYLLNYAAGLARRELRSPVTADTNTVRDAISGQLGFQFTSSLGIGGFLGGILGQIPYDPPGQDPAAAAMRERAASAASQEDLALTAYDAQGKRIDGLTDLAGKIGTQQDAGARMDLQARLTAEQAFAQSQTNQILALTYLGHQEELRQDAKERLLARQSADDMVRSSRAIIDARGVPRSPAASSAALAGLL